MSTFEAAVLKKPKLESEPDVDLLIEKAKEKLEKQLAPLLLMMNLQDQEKFDLAVLARVVSALTKGAKERSVVIWINRGAKK